MAVNRAVRKRLPPEIAARYVGIITPEQHGAKNAIIPATNASAAEPPMIVVEAAPCTSIYSSSSLRNRFSERRP